MRIIEVLAYFAVLIIASCQANSLGSVLGVCSIDSHCKNSAQYCDHKAPNPVGKCKAKHRNSEHCLFDRHCMSNKCNWTKCVSNRPTKDGLCSKGEHYECIDSQYCGKNNRCKNRHPPGSTCVKSAECLSNRCSFFKCQKPNHY